MNVWGGECLGGERLTILGLGLGLETFAKFLRVSVSRNLVSEKKSRFRKNWYHKKSLGIGFGQNFGIVIQCI